MRDETVDLVAEVARLEGLLRERQDELTALQQELQRFKARYTQIVGSQLSELAEIEQSIREAEARLQESMGADATEAADADVDGAANGAQKTSGGGGLRKLFWSVAKLFHPDHAADGAEAERRHLIMAEATRAYREGDVESLHTLLGDEDLQFYCAAPAAGDSPQDLRGRLFQIKEELRTVEFGIKRVKQDGLYRSMLRAESEAANGRDMLADEAARIRRQIAKARHRLTNLT
ncbi:MAG TPA: hypothetical protein VF527_13795 [Pyrinomonadaceae bacterium]|jgi:hypothetical protein